MTVEEAIADIRDNIKPIVGGISLDMAIKALEQEPILDKTLISTGRRDDMNYKNFTSDDWIEHISGVIEDETTLDGNEMRDLVKFLTTMKEPKTGRWVWEINETPSTPVSSYELNYEGWVCDCCHQFPDDICEWDDLDEPPIYKFCPNCGADMRESEE